MKPFVIQFEQIVAALVDLHRFTIQCFAQLLIFHCQSLIFLKQKNQFFFNAAKSTNIVPIWSSICVICCNVCCLSNPDTSYDLFGIGHFFEFKSLHTAGFRQFDEQRLFVKVNSSDATVAH